MARTRSTTAHHHMPDDWSEADLRRARGSWRSRQVVNEVRKPPTLACLHSDLYSAFCATTKLLDVECDGPPGFEVATTYS